MKILLCAEIGCNHQGSVSLAMSMIRAAAASGADIVKFQKRSPRELLSPTAFNAPHPVPENAFGDSYGAHREHLELSGEDHQWLALHCAANGVAYSSSVWDITSAKEIATFAPAMIKVPSASNTDDAMLGWLAANFGGELHISLGMTSPEEESRIIEILSRANRLSDTVLYACVSGYPVSAGDACLLEITRLRWLYGGSVKMIGYSGHHLGIALDPAAAALGAGIIERHFTLDKEMKGTDHSASLTPSEFAALREAVDDTAAALQPKPLLPLAVERETRRKLKNLCS
ncbi:MAG: N-acetylneuraminate synthase family protein [Clostridiales bacterium]|nr:N-acetylneuraminate synthase family protein [Clostridiales bacterium]